MPMRRTWENVMYRSMILGAGLLGLAAGVSFTPAAQASPLIPAAPLSQAIAGSDGVEQVHYYRRYHRRHYGWYRGHHYGWRHHHRRHYGYYRGYY
jgi:hypothetical protein